MEQKNKILIVDDASSVLRAIKDILDPEYIVKTASSGEQGLDTLKQFHADLVLLDVVMTGINGYEVCRRIRSDGSFAFTKIIMVSSRVLLEERLKGYEAGADDYLGKPFKAEEMLAKVRVFLRLKAVEDELKALNEQLNEQVQLRTEQLLNAEKLAAVGRYAAGIVHNLNNPLQSVMGNAEILAMKHPDNRNIMNLRKAAAHMKKIISTILSTSYMESTEEYGVIDLNEVLANQIELLDANRFFKHQVQTVENLTPLPPYRGIYVHFSQSLGNLIKNAVESMYQSEKKQLTIESFVEKGAVIIEISDTGPGIPQEKVVKIFSPFYTTKPLTATDERPTGTGLGLASAKEMIESYGGDITVRSKPGNGATFTVRLPLK